MGLVFQLAAAPDGSESVAIAPASIVNVSPQTLERRTSEQPNRRGPRVGAVGSQTSFLSSRKES
jgi:hypothetical protein